LNRKDGVTITSNYEKVSPKIKNWGIFGCLIKIQFFTEGL